MQNCGTVAAMHGGGGDDTFVFGGNWGNDTIEQLATGKVTLWFKEATGTWNAETLTYTDGANSVRVLSDMAEVSLKFGNEDARYADLFTAGAFDDFSTERIFKDNNKGMLA